MPEDCDSIGSDDDASLSISEYGAGEGSPEHVLARKQVLGVVLPEPNYYDLFKLMSTVILSTGLFLLGGMLLPELQAFTGMSDHALYTLQISLVILLANVTTMILIYITRRMKWKDDHLIEKPSHPSKGSSAPNKKTNTSKHSPKTDDKGSLKVDTSPTESANASSEANS